VRKLLTAAIAPIVVTLSIVLAGCGSTAATGSAGGDAATPGITKTSVVLGGSYPFSGPAAAYSTLVYGADAAFDAANASGGVNGRKIRYITLDDGYDPSRALQDAHELIAQDHVFAIFGSAGTPTNFADWDYINHAGVPDLFLISGASDWGADIKAHPWTIGGLPSFVSEARIYARYLEQVMPHATVAILYQNDEFGQDYLGGFLHAIAGSGLRVVAKQDYVVTEPSVDTQVANLAASKAQVFVDFSTAQFTIQAIKRAAALGWKPLHIIPVPDASKTQVLEPAGLADSTGIISVDYSKDPTDPKWAEDSGVKQYLAAVKRYTPKANPDDFNVEEGWIAAQAMIAALRGMKQPTRADLMAAARSLDLEEGVLLPGLTVNTTHGYPIQTMYVARFNGSTWTLQGPPITETRGY
jgi:branched-chain amino acid transport system substrate-binding protein